MSDSAKPRSRKFSQQEDQFILQSFKDGRRTVEIANSLSRHQSSVRGRLTMLLDLAGAPQPAPQWRMWTDDEVRLAHRLYSSGWPYEKIACTMGRTRKSIIAKIRQILDDETDHPEDDSDAHEECKVARQESPNQTRWLPSHQPARRKCLRCGELFNSAHAGNRICPGCSSINARLTIDPKLALFEHGQ